MKRLVLALTVAGATLVAAAAPHPPILAFGRINPGEWQLRALDGSAPPRRLCVQNPSELIQLRHPGTVCSRFVLTNEARAATVHYTCPGAGYGRTTVKIETPALLRLESQGLVDQMPFQVAFEARRLGDCGSDAPPR